MSLLSQYEADQLQNTSKSKLYNLFRRCCLAVLNAGEHTDNSNTLLTKFDDFEINVIRSARGVKLELCNAPQSAFVDGELIDVIQEHLFAMLRDLIYVENRYKSKLDEITDPSQITHLIFDILRNAQTISSRHEPDMVVCWGGHSINQTEYDYAQEVGYQLGLRKLNIITGCGPGAMEAPMKGASVGHARQQRIENRYVGLTEPSIIACEPPNFLVNELVILPDIEKRLEAFVRLAHSIIIFAGGPGTAEELLYLLGILLHEENADEPMPVVLTGPASSAEYFAQINKFIGNTLGVKAQQRYRIIIDDPSEVARYIKNHLPIVKEHRKALSDSYHFNWSLHIEPEFQFAFEPNHQNMNNLNLHFEQTPAELAANLRKAFSGIVAGNVKDFGIAAIAEHGLFKLKGNKDLMHQLDMLLDSFVKQGRMKIEKSDYKPCYEINVH